MTPLPEMPDGATGPVRLVVAVFPKTAGARATVRRAVGAKLAACANMLAAESTYLWRGHQEEAPELVVWFKTTPKKVGALFRYLATHHPYEVPDIFELDVARVHGPYLKYVLETLERQARRSRATHHQRGVRRPGSPRGPAGSRPE